MTKQANHLKEGEQVIMTIDGEKCIFQLKRSFTFSALDYCYLDFVRINANTGKFDNQNIYGYFDNSRKFEIYGTFQSF